MVQSFYTTKKEGQQNTDYSVKLIGTAEKTKNLKETVHITSLKSKKQLSEVAGERSFLYNMYLSYLEADSNFECQVSADILPTPTEATDTTIEVEFDGTATSDVAVDFAIFDTKHEIKMSFANGTTATQIASTLITEIKKWKDLPFDVADYTDGSAKITFTSRVKGPAGSLTPVKAHIEKGDGITSSISITEGTNGANADEIIAYVNNKKIKNRLYIFEDGIDTDNFRDSLKNWQDYKNSDKRGRMISTEVDTLENLIQKAEEYNESSQTILGLKKVSKDGFSTGHIFKQPCCFSSFIAGVLNLVYTFGTDLSKINSIIGIGDPSNVSLPLAGTVLQGYTIIDGEEWMENEDGNEVDLLTKSGISVFTTNKIGNLVMGDLVTTYTMDKEGNKDVNFHWVAFDECVSSFLSYLFARQKRTLSHARLESVTKAKFIADCQIAYKVCSGKANDEELKRSFLFCEPEGLNDFLDTLRKNTIENYADGELISQSLQIAVYSQLRRIIMNFKFGYNK